MASKFGSSVAGGRPDLVAEWSPKNEKSPNEVRPGSQLKIIWVGPCGHEWVAPVDNRVYNNTGCPFCTSRGGKRLLPGLNDLATVNPVLAAEWHPTKNGTITPEQTLPAVKARYWWLCPDCGREWYALLNMRHSRGTGCPSCRGRKRGVSASGAGHWSRLDGEWSPKNRLQLSEFSVSSQQKAHWICAQGHEWQASIGDRNLKKTGCKQCGSGGSSAPEVELRNFVESLGVQIRAHHRQIDPKYEFDITVPEQNVAIEFNGIYWHQESIKGANYHRQKTQAANEAGWQVIHVWEDDWRDRPEVVKEMLSHKLGVSTGTRYNARSLKIGPASSTQARDFLDAHHIQGFVPGSVRMGLWSEDALVALMVLRSRGSGVWELSRYATAGIVRGGFSRLLKSVIADTSARQIVTFSDRGISDGGLYESTGFIEDGELKPDYMYVVKNHRVHKFNYRIKRFREDANLKYEEGMTERELAALNGLPRIYDAGKVRWVLDVNVSC